jgi:hypothetical protein
MAPLVIGLDRNPPKSANQTVKAMTTPNSPSGVNPQAALEAGQ